ADRTGEPGRLVECAQTILESWTYRAIVPAGFNLARGTFQRSRQHTAGKRAAPSAKSPASSAKSPASSAKSPAPLSDVIRKFHATESGNPPPSAPAESSART